MSMHALVQELVELAERVESDYESCSIDEKGAEQLAILLAAIREARAGLATFASVVERDLLAEMGSKAITVEGLGFVEAKASVRRTKWQTGDLVAAIVSRVADEPGVFFSEEDGAMLPYATIGHNVAARLRDCLSISSGKVTGLRAIGIDPSEYCTEEEAHWSVRLPGRDAL